MLLTFVYMYGFNSKSLTQLLNATNAIPYKMMGTQGTQRPHRLTYTLSGEKQKALS